MKRELFKKFCDDVQEMGYAIQRILEDDALLEIEYAIFDGYRFEDGSKMELEMELDRVRNKKTEAILEILREFNPTALGGNGQ